MEPDDITRLTQSPIAVWLVIIIMFLIMIASAVPKILGPIGTGIAQWGQRRRAERAERDDADIADLRRQNTHLQTELTRERSLWGRRVDRWRTEWHVHRQWDYRAQEALLGTEPPFDLAPPFMTPDPPEEENP